MKKKTSNKFSLLIYIIALAGMSYLYGYEKIITYRPTSVHQHRQCDCLSFAYNYYKCNNNFFDPQVNYLSGKNFDGKNTSEFPVLHYTVAKLWKIFGYHEWIYRLLAMIIMFSGLIALFKIFQFVLKETFWQIVLPLWLFSSPIFVYYGNNFLADVPGLSFAIIGWYFFIRYIQKNKILNLISAMIFFCLAMLIKITSGISFLAFVILFFVEWIKSKKEAGTPLFKRPLLTLSLITGVCAVVISWYVYAILYNKANLRPDEFPMFLTNILPIWNLPLAKIIMVSRIIFDYQMGNYFNFIGLMAIFVFLFIIVMNYKKQNRQLFLINIIIFLCCTGGMLLWFEIYDEHDYYFINFLIFIPVTCLTFFKFIQNEHPQIFSSLKLKIPILLIVLISIYWAYAKMDSRYGEADKKDYTYSSFLSRYEVENQMYAHWIYPQEKLAFETITPYLRSIGISEQDKVFSFPDPSPNITLYLMGQRGISLNNNNSTELLKSLNQYKSLKIKYFILGDTSLLHDEIIKKILVHKIGEYRTVFIYDISGLKLSHETISCDAESLDNDVNYFKGTSDSVKFSGVNSRTSDRHRSGNYAVCLDDKNQYGFSVKLHHISPRQIIKVTVWRYAESGDSGAGICLSGENAGDFYNFNAKHESVDADGWQQISSEVRLPENMNGKNLSIYAFNPEKGKKVYFDDIEISILNIPE